MPTIKRGENTIIRKNLLDSDGETPLVISSLATISAQIKQYGYVLAEYVLLPTPNPVQGQIRVGATTNQLEVEIVEALSETFKEGSVTMKILMRKADAQFIVDTKWRDLDDEEIFTVES